MLLGLCRQQECHLWLCGSYGLAYDELGSAEKYGHGHRRKTWNYPII